MTIKQISRIVRIVLWLAWALPNYSTALDVYKTHRAAIELKAKADKDPLAPVIAAARGVEVGAAS